MTKSKKFTGFIVTFFFWGWVLTQTHTVERVVHLPKINQWVIAGLAIFIIVCSVYMFGRWAFRGTLIGASPLVFDPDFADWVAHWQMWSDYANLFQLLIFLFIVFIVIGGFVYSVRNSAPEY